MKISSELTWDRRVWGASIQDLVTSAGDAGSTHHRAAMCEFIQFDEEEREEVINVGFRKVIVPPWATIFHLASLVA